MGKSNVQLNFQGGLRGVGGEGWGSRAWLRVGVVRARRRGEAPPPPRAPRRDAAPRTNIQVCDARVRWPARQHGPDDVHA